MRLIYLRDEDWQVVLDQRISVDNNLVENFVSAHVPKVLGSLQIPS